MLFSAGVGDRLPPLGFFDCKIGGVEVIIALLARLCKFRTSILVMTRGLAAFFKASRPSSEDFVYIMEAERHGVGIEVPTGGPPGWSRCQKSSDVNAGA